MAAQPHTRQDPVSGTSLLQFAVMHCPIPRLIDGLLGVKCNIGLAADARNTTALHTAITQGKWRSLQQLLDALLGGRFGHGADTMGLVMACFEQMAAK